MTKLSSLPFFNSKPWFENSNSIWMLTYFELHRNLNKHFFPHKLEPEFLKKLSEMLAQALISCPSLKKSKVFSASTLTPFEKQLLYEHYLPKKDFSQFRDSEMILLDPLGNSHITLNMEDHLHFSKLDAHDQLEETWNSLLKIENSLAKSLEFAYSPKFGFTTSDPRKCGTGLTVQTVLHLPALIHLEQLEEKIQKINPNFFEVSGFGGDVESALGDFILISNRQTLGHSEESILKNIRRVTLELILAEKTAREQLSGSDKTLLKDKIGKAFGVLRHSSKLSLSEALSLLSLCKLGLELDWLTGISVQEINVLLFTIRKSYLTLNLESSSKEELDKIRSQYIHQKIDLLTLKD